jgi:Fic family protein
MDDLNVSRITATRYLDELDAIRVLQKQKIWKESYYINKDLFRLLTNVNEI